MKRYISSILIPCLLLQLWGCYSFRDITIDELKKYSGENDVKIKSDKEEIIINRKSSGIKFMHWDSNDSSIIVSQKELILMKDSSIIDEENFNIKYDSIVDAQIEEIDNATTLLFVIGIAAVGIYLIASIAVAMNGGVLGN